MDPDLVREQNEEERESRDMRPKPGVADGAAQQAQRLDLEQSPQAEPGPNLALTGESVAQDVGLNAEAESPSAETFEEAASWQAPIVQPNLPPASAEREASIAPDPRTVAAFDAALKSASPMPGSEDHRRRPNAMQRLAALVFWTAIGCMVGALAAVGYTEHAGVAIEKARVVILGAVLYGGLAAAFIKLRRL